MINSRITLSIFFSAVSFSAQAGSGPFPDYLIDCSIFSYTRIPGENESALIQRHLEHIFNNEEKELQKIASLAKKAANEKIIKKYYEFSLNTLCKIATASEDLYPARAAGVGYAINNVEDYFKTKDIIFPSFGAPLHKINKSFKVRLLNRVENLTIPLMDGAEKICIAFENKTDLCLRHYVKKEPPDNFTRNWRRQNKALLKEPFVYYTGIGVSLSDNLKQYNIKCGWSKDPIKNCPDKQVLDFQLDRKKRAEIEFRVNKAMLISDNKLNFSVLYRIVKE